VLFGFMAWFVYHVYTSFKSATGTFWQRLYSSTKGTSTLFWGFVLNWVNAAFNFVMQLADLFGATQFETWANANFNPKVASTILLVGTGTLMAARLRSLSLGSKT